MNRREVLKEVTKLTETHCKKCQVTKLIETKVMNQRFCLNKCVIGQEFQRLGEMLAPETMAKEKQKNKIVEESKKRGRPTEYDHITKEIFLAELKTGKTYREIEQSLGIGKRSIKYLFSRHGLEGRRGTHNKSIASVGVHQGGDAQLI